MLRRERSWQNSEDGARPGCANSSRGTSAGLFLSRSAFLNLKNEINGAYTLYVPSTYGGH